MCFFLFFQLHLFGRKTGSDGSFWCVDMDIHCDLLLESETSSRVQEIRMLVQMTYSKLWNCIYIYIYIVRLRRQAAGGHAQGLWLPGLWLSSAQGIIFIIMFLESTITYILEDHSCQHSGKMWLLEFLEFVIASLSDNWNSWHSKKYVLPFSRSDNVNCCLV